jgi:hypothetical protein
LCAFPKSTKATLALCCGSYTPILENAAPSSGHRDQRARAERRKIKLDAHTYIHRPLSTP